MPRVVRHDLITLHREVREEDFERFMKEELMPFFSDQYRGPTRASLADIQSQSLLKDTKGRRKWLWVTAWDGSVDALRGSYFEGTRMISIEGTEEMLKKFESLGKRSTEKVFTELDRTEVATNTSLRFQHLDPAKEDIGNQARS
jgi:hypothetical protein